MTPSTAAFYGYRDCWLAVHAGSAQDYTPPEHSTDMNNLCVFAAPLEPPSQA